MVSFKDIATTVKQVLGPMVLQSIPDLEEVLLDKVGFRIVNVKDYATLDIVQGLLEAAPGMYHKYRRQQHHICICCMHGGF